MDFIKIVGSLVLLIFLGCSFGVGRIKISIMVQTYLYKHKSNFGNLLFATITLMSIFLMPITILVGIHEIFCICIGRGNKYVIEIYKNILQLILNILTLVFCLGIVMWILQSIINFL